MRKLTFFLLCGVALAGTLGAAKPAPATRPVTIEGRVDATLGSPPSLVVDGIRVLTSKFTVITSADPVARRAHIRPGVKVLVTGKLTRERTILADRVFVYGE